MDPITVVDAVQIISALGVIAGAYWKYQSDKAKNQALVAELSAKLDSAIGRIRHLEEENSFLRAENAGLKQRVDDLVERLLRAKRGGKGIF